MNDFLNLPPLRKPRVSKPRPVSIPTRYDLRKLYYDARKVMFEREYPKAWKDGKYYDGKVPDITKTNGHNRYIEDVINFNGHHAEQIKTMGTPVKQKDGSIKWRYSSTTNGSPDIHTIVNGKPWKIETKNLDSMREKQIEYEAKMKKLGVLHSVIRVGELDLFWDEYYRIMAL